MAPPIQPNSHAGPLEIHRRSRASRREDAAAAQPAHQGPRQPDSIGPAQNPPPNNLERDEGCGICSLICRCIVALFTSLCRLFSSHERASRIAPQISAQEMRALNPEQRRVAAFLNRFPENLDDEADHRDEFFNAFQALPAAAQQQARKNVFTWHRREFEATLGHAAEKTEKRRDDLTRLRSLMDEYGLTREAAVKRIGYDPAINNDPTEAKKPVRTITEQDLRDQEIDKFIANNHFNYAVREALNAFIGREPLNEDE